MVYCKLLVLRNTRVVSWARLTGRASFKGALNPNFLNLTINREKFWLLKRFGSIP